ncbi:MAG: hypothetical protein MJ080_00435 [Clostridia bacterium]|nr:hypothetical protein [Clostridia bacterium]
MKKIIKNSIIVLLCGCLLAFVGCSKVDKSNPAEKNTSEKPEKRYENIVPPEIPSDDKVMPTFLDISYYNVENYSEIYLGKKFEVKTLYDGVELTAPSDYKTFIQKGFSQINNDINENSRILANEKCVIRFKNAEGHLIDVTFYNHDSRSKPLSECSLIKYDSSLGNIFGSKDVGNFSVNGISNCSSLSEAITILGFPSHFHKESKDIYSIDYFFSKKDLRSRITIYAKPNEDSITAISYAFY